MLANTGCLLYNELRCELIAMKREVAAQHDRAGFPWSKCQVMIPGDKSLYRTKYFCESRKRVVSAVREAEKPAENKLSGFLVMGNQGSSCAPDLFFRRA